MLSGCWEPTRMIGQVLPTCSAENIQSWVETIATFGFQSCTIVTDGRASKEGNRVICSSRLHSRIRLWWQDDTTGGIVWHVLDGLYTSSLSESSHVGKELQL